MNTTESYFVGLLRGFATGSEPQQNTDNVDENELLSLAKRHSVQGIVAHMVSRYGHSLSEESAAQLSKAYDRTVMQMVHRETSAKILCQRLSLEGIPHILFKGLTVSDSYPVKELRTYGDVDIIVNEGDRDRIRVLMTDMGYKRSIADGGTVTVYVKGREHYELHTALNVSMIKDNEYFSHIWENALMYQDETRMFKPDFHLCYLISHLEKHVYGSGAGIKMYLDIALFIDKHRDEIDLNKVREVLRGCGLQKFFSTVLYVCHRWFSLEIPDWVEELADEVYTQMCEFTLGDGIFGDQSEENTLNTALRNEVATGKKGARLRVLLSRVFPPFYELCRIYPRFEGKPLLAPVAWMNHVLSVLKQRKFSRVGEIATADTKAVRQKKDFFEAIGSQR